MAGVAWCRQVALRAVDPLTVLHVHRADRADALLTTLAALLATPPADPFAPELVAVPTRGIERWLTQGLAHHLGAGPGRGDGVVANVRFPPPRRLIDDAVAAACGVDTAADPWAPERVLWPLLEELDARPADPARPALDGDRRLAAVRHLAGLFDRYGLHRPAMLRAWAHGEDVDGTGAPLALAHRWQVEVWRALRARIGTPSPAERLAQAVAVLSESAPPLHGPLAGRTAGPDRGPGPTHGPGGDRDAGAACAGGADRDDGTVTRTGGPPALALPERFAVFGLTRLPAGHIDVLTALAVHRDVHLLLLHPSPTLWERTAPARARTPRRAEDPTATLPTNPLLASWGRDVRELQLLLQGERAELCTPYTQSSPDLLGRLQADVRADRRPTRAERAPSDRSVELHACHGRARQVEVLRDALLHALEDDPTLEPRDVIVMCPDIEAFAPLIQAAFDTDASRPDRPDLRVRLADRALRQTNPVIATIGRVLELADGRLAASEVLDLADRAPVRRRFRWEDDEIARLEDWTSRSGVRWGLDAAGRTPFKLDRVAAGTWQAGLDRVLLGATMTEEGDPLIGGVLPFDDVESGAIDLAGRFAELVDRLGTVVASFRARRPLNEWAEALGTAADLLTATAPRDAWQRAELDRLLGTLVADAAGRTLPLGLAELRDLLAEPLKGRPTRAGFRTGHLTFCTLNPMRSVPHRVVALLGLDEASFPRKAPWDGDDLVAEDPHLGDHDGRTEDRQLLLDALMAAEGKLIVTYTGNDERTNAPRPPAVPVGELLDVIEATCGERPVVHHPLQGFDPRAFTGERPSFDRVALDGARALRGERPARPPLLAAPLPPLDEPVLELEELVRFVAHPARAFLRRRLGVSLGRPEDELADELPIELDALEEWAVADRLLAAMLRGATAQQASAAELARGTLPPGELSRAVFRKVGGRVRAIVTAAQGELGRTDELASLDARLRLPDGRLLHGTVAGLQGEILQTVTASKVGPRPRLSAWVRLLVLTLARPEQPWRSVVIGRARQGAHPRAEVTICRAGPLTPDDAAAQLAVLLDLHDRAMREPAPLALKTSAALALGTQEQARQAWENGRFPGEQADPEHRLLLGAPSLAERLAHVPRADEPWGADTRLEAWAQRLWSGPLACEEVEDR